MYAPKRLFTAFAWFIIITLNLVFIYMFPFKHFNAASWNKPFGHLLAMHIISGLFAIVLGPLQFISKLRINYPSIHRFTGKVYLLAVLSGSLAAIILSIAHVILTEHKLVLGTGLFFMSVAWLLTAAIAFRSVLKKQFKQHREWMIKNFVITCGFTVFRLGVGLLMGVAHIKEIEALSIMAWACWSVPLLITDAVLKKNAAVKISLEEKKLFKMSGS